MKNLKRWWIALVVAASVGAGVLGNGLYRARAETAAAAVAAPSPQDTFNLERRISALEQRLYTIETSINRLEQQSASGARTAPSTDRREVELELVQAQLRVLQGQLGEIGCGLLKVDERTLPSNARQARRADTAASIEPCRLNPDTPVRLSTSTRE